MKLSLLLLAALCVSVSGMTRVKKAKGAAVVEESLKILRRPCVFPDNYLFLRRLAYISTEDGHAINTFQAGYYGGIWKVERTMYDLTKKVSKRYMTLIFTVFKIRWKYTIWEDLHKPLYSALAAQLYLIYLSERHGLKIPVDVVGQAKFWAKHLKKLGDWRLFVSESKKIPRECKVKADVAFVLDVSASISDENFRNIINFVKGVIGNLNVGFNLQQHSQVSMLTYSSDVMPLFAFNTYSDLSDIYTAIDNITHVAQRTYTYKALKYLAHDVFTAANGARPNVRKVAVILTDGNSYPRSKTMKAVKHLRETDIEVYAAGEGESINVKELYLLASDPDCTHVVVLEHLPDPVSFARRLEWSLCNATEVQTTTPEPTTEAVTTAAGQLTYNCGDRNPCGPPTVVPNKFHYAHDDPNKFVQCANYDSCFVKSCPYGLIFNDRIQSCDYPTG